MDDPLVDELMCRVQNLEQENRRLKQIGRSALLVLILVVFGGGVLQVREERMRALEDAARAQIEAMKAVEAARRAEAEAAVRESMRLRDAALFNLTSRP